MIRIDKIRHDGYLVNLVPEHHSPSGDNTYTVIVGKNGVGKSRLLTSIAKAGLEYSESERAFFDYPHVHLDRDPLVIAISTSPFDKFPTISRTSSRRDKYKYIGMRGDSRFSASSAVALIASASKGLLHKIISGANSADFLEVFNALSFSPRADFIFKPAFTRAKVQHDHDRPGPPLYFEVVTTDGEDKLRVDGRYQRAFEELTTEEKSNAGYAMANIARFFDERKAIDLAIDFELNTIDLDGQLASPYIVNSILMLMDVGLIRLMDLRLYKHEFGLLNLKRASSGEQCLIVLMLGIAGHIEDGSLILIDEPEISLHPRWQEEFMQLLSRSFWRYSFCQFIVATHSPQVVSQIGRQNSFVLSLPSGYLHEGDSFKNKSADFQLAELFDAPGMMNEYISRITFDLIAKLRSRKSVSDEMLRDIHQLRCLRRKLNHEDPMVKLIDSADELVSYYANDI
ncbi:AAA family ATPase [Pseudomonas aeruginosa]|uniref:AAA family ATPase n=1 Tax=Pseudomonas TaxID=286 RepID=UPI000A72F9B8|nr:AAA family ATPase [Pseudomonas aeruginosa]MCA6847202.1 ATP-binding protein [Pseudomonas aeruginosa]MCA6859716.1 ATP-binding protein [Pseudomonas aeruginosa]MCA6877340.1 ATP-binding protein [Pseudomonas aeruginosa]MCS8382587.1 ATP-binding protein [Pseudomonas aeruginosa]MCS8456081.1 ATP-binding protein [Pseudomonas aeruginosa]